MVIFSHRGIGFGRKENYLEAFNEAVKEGFSVEADLRSKDNEVILAHDEPNSFTVPAEFSGFLKLINNNPYILFALHIKENSRLLFERIADTIGPLKNCFIFVTDFPQDEFIETMFRAIGKESLALYITSKNINYALAGKTSYFWVDETQGDIFAQLKCLNNLKKKIICCSPELFSRNHNARKEFLKKEIRKNNIFGVCTDTPDFYKENYECTFRNT